MGEFGAIFERMREFVGVAKFAVKHVVTGIVAQGDRTEIVGWGCAVTREKTFA
jgi:hypothetical protein